jgi:hypothetical protein
MVFVIKLNGFAGNFCMVSNKTIQFYHKIIQLDGKILHLGFLLFLK